MSKKNYENLNLPVVIVAKASEMNYDIPSIFKGGYKGTFTQIHRACNESLGDEFGNIYINSRYLDTILRTKKFIAKEILCNIPENERVSNDNNTYIKCGHIMKLINERLQTIGSSKTRDYLLLVESFLINIRDSEKMQNVRNKLQADFKAEIISLKKRRKQRYKIINDELTGEKLKRFSQFSHIRAKGAYPSLALNIDNGLIVNQEVHEIITAKGVVNEDELLELCGEQKWSTKWYKSFKELVL